MATAIQTTTPEDRIEVFMRKPETLERFRPLLGKNAEKFIASALILINSDPKLQKCTTMSLYKSVLRAASLELSLDTSLRQGFIVPRGRKVKATKDTPEHYIQEANFQPHYNGVRNLAERTGIYKIINVSPIYEGQKIRLDQMTGLHYIHLGGETFGMPEQVSRLTVANTLDVTGGKPKEKVIGYLGYYETWKGIKRTVWMTIDEIHEHAQKWAPDNYNSEYGSWKDSKKLPYMEMKTVFLQLTKTMDLSGKEFEKLRKAIEIENGDNFEDLENGEQPEAITGKATTIQPEIIPALMTKEQAYAVKFHSPIGDVELGSMANADQLNAVYLSENATDEQKQAVTLILKQDFSMEPPEVKKTVDRAMKELGYA